MTLLTEPTRIVLRKDSVAATDTNIREVSLLLHGNGTNGSTTITDSSLTPKTVTAVGNAQISTAQSKFGGASIAFDGAGDYATIPAGPSFDYTSTDFTWEAWVRFNNISGIQAIIADANFSTGSGRGLLLRLFSQKLGVAGYNNSNSPFVLVGDLTNISINTWYHLAFARSGNNYRVFLNGAQEGATVTNSTNLVYASNTLYLGGWEGFAGLRDFNGYIDDLRITKGVARYTANFTPPTAPFPDF
jgi:hypothetical protein